MEQKPPRTNRLRCVIYGQRERIEAFLMEQRLIASSEVLKRFGEKMTYHTIEATSSLQATAIQPEKHVLHFDIHMRDWKSFYREMWLEFLNHALHFRLDWEIVWVGDVYPDIEWILTPAAIKILFIHIPFVSETKELGPAIPMKKF